MIFWIGGQNIVTHTFQKMQKLLGFGLVKALHQSKEPISVIAFVARDAHQIRKGTNELLQFQNFISFLSRTGAKPISPAARHNRQVRTRFCRTNLGRCHVKILVKPLGFTVFLPCTHQKFVPAKFSDLWCEKY